MQARPLRAVRTPTCRAGRCLVASMVVVMHRTGFKRDVKTYHTQTMSMMKGERKIGGPTGYGNNPWNGNWRWAGEIGQTIGGRAANNRLFIINISCSHVTGVYSLVYLYKTLKKYLV